jgi:hypothetical protein
MLSGSGTRSNTLLHRYKCFMKYPECLKKMGIFLQFYPLHRIPLEPYEGYWHQVPQYQFKYLLDLCHFHVVYIRTTYLSYKRHHEILEIRAICKKSAHNSPVAGR